MESLLVMTSLRRHSTTRSRCRMLCQGAIGNHTATHPEVPLLVTPVRVIQDRVKRRHSVQFSWKHLMQRGTSEDGLATNRIVGTVSSPSASWNGKASATLRALPCCRAETCIQQRLTRTKRPKSMRAGVTSSSALTDYNIVTRDLPHMLIWNHYKARAKNEIALSFV
eukprot:47207-Amphidinium_carterae.1